MEVRNSFDDRKQEINQMDGYLGQQLISFNIHWTLLHTECIIKLNTKYHNLKLMLLGTIRFLQSRLNLI